jgi:hypothetical protein
MAIQLGMTEEFTVGWGKPDSNPGLLLDSQVRLVERPLLHESLLLVLGCGSAEQASHPTDSLLMASCQFLKEDLLRLASEDHNTKVLLV